MTAPDPGSRPDPGGATDAGALGTVARVVLLLRRIAEAPGEVSVNALAREVGLPAGTIHRLLNDLALPVMHRVVGELSESRILGIYNSEDASMSFVEQVDSPHALKFIVPRDTHLPLAWGCSGRVMLAFLPEREIDRVLEAAGPSPVSGRPLPNPDLFKETSANSRFVTQTHRIRPGAWRKPATGGSPYWEIPGQLVAARASASNSVAAAKRL